MPLARKFVDAFACPVEWCDLESAKTADFNHWLSDIACDVERAKAAQGIVNYEVEQYGKHVALIRTWRPRTVLDSVNQSAIIF